MSQDQWIDRRDYGMLEAQVAQLRMDVATLTTNVQNLTSTMQQAKGGWRALLLLSGVAGTIGAVGSWAATHLRFT